MEKASPILFSRWTLLAGVLFLWFSPPPSPAASLHSLQRNGLLVLSEPSLQAAAQEASDLYPGVRKGLEESLRWHVRFQPTLILVKERRAFVKMAGSDLFVAYAVPERRLMVIDYSRMTAHPFTIEVTMKHELCHLLLHDQIDRKNLPTWLDEGVAQWTSGGLAEIIAPQKGRALKRATIAKSYLSLKALSVRFPRDGDALILAYEQSESVVAYIAARFGVDSLIELLHHLKRGDVVEMAVLKALSVSMDQLEAEWQRELGRGLTLFTLMIDHLYEILFFLAALTTVYGFVRYVIKKRTYRDPDQDDSERTRI